MRLACESKPRYLSAFTLRLNKKGAGFILLISTLFVVAGSWYATRVTFDYSVLAMQDETTEAMTTLVSLQKNDQFNDYGIAVMLSAKEDNADIINQLENLPLVSRVVTSADIVPQFQSIKQHMMLPVHQSLISLDTIGLVSEEGAASSIDDFKRYLLQLQPEFFDEDQVIFDRIANALLLIESDPSAIKLLTKATALGVKQDVSTLKSWFAAKPFNETDLPSSLRARFFGQQDIELIQVLPSIDLKDRAMMSAFIEQVAGVAPNIAGRSVVEWGVGSIVKRAFVEATFIAIGLIFLVLLCYFKSFIWPLIVFVPIGMTAIFAFCLIRFTGLTLNMANILVVPLIFGLGVDTGLHVLHRYRQEGSLDALALSSTHLAVLISALTTIGTFFSLSFSAHQGAASIGILLSASILFLLIAAFVVLPAILTLVSRKTS